MRYLLGNLTESEKARMEEDYFADDSKFEAFELTEDDLIDAYVRNELSSAEQLQFEKNLLSLPRIRERVNFARTLAEKINSAQPPKPEASIEPAPSFSSSLAESNTPWWKRLFVAQSAFGMAMTSAVLILIPSVVLVTGWFRLKNETERLAAELSAVQHQKEVLDKQLADQRTSAEQSRAEFQREADRLAEAKKVFEESVAAQKRANETKSILGTVIPILLTSGGVRSSGEPHELRLRPRTSVAQLKLVLKNNAYRKYSVSVNTPDDHAVYRNNSVRPQKTKQGPLLILSIPTSKLPPNNYTIEIDGRTASGQVEKLPSYQFRVLPSK